MTKRKDPTPYDTDLIEVYTVMSFLDGTDRYEANSWYIVPRAKAGIWLAHRWVLLAPDIDKAPRLDVAKRPWYRRFFRG